MTVHELARSCGLSRGTILHYESLGLLKPARRTSSNYRRYSEEDLARLRQVCIYRSTGLSLADIRTLMDRPGSDARTVLERRMAEIDREVAELRRHQQAILRLLQSQSSTRRIKDMTKEKWVEIMKATGFTEDDMHRWHTQFERSAPEDHQQFLQFLNIPATEITKIREWSKKG